MIILYINHGFNKWKRFILFTLLQADSPLCVLLSLRLLSHCRASGVSAVIIHPSFNSVKPGHSDWVLDQVNKYLTYAGLYFNVPQMPVIPRGSSCVSWASDRMICLSHLISFLLPLNGQCLIEAAVNREQCVLLACTTKLCTSVI